LNALIAVLPGDGVGPEVTAQAVRALEAAASTTAHTLSFEHAPIGAAAIDACGSPLPAATLELCRRADAVLLGAVGGRAPGTDGPRPEEALLGLRRALGTFANLRPVRALPALAAASPLRPERVAGTDLLFVRELTGGIYFGRKSRTRRGTGGERASDTCAYSTREVERVSPPSTRRTCSRPRGCGARWRSASCATSSPTSGSSTCSSIRSRCGCCRRLRTSTCSSPRTCSATS
jgi:3-isopropylmalate dehydrogenase